MVRMISSKSAASQESPREGETEDESGSKRASLHR